MYGGIYDEPRWTHVLHAVYCCPSIVEVDPTTFRKIRQDKHKSRFLLASSTQGSQHKHRETVKNSVAARLTASQQLMNS